MKQNDILAGFIVGIITSVIGTYLFLEFFSDSGAKSFMRLRHYGLLGKVLTLGSILNLIVFFIMVSQKKDQMANGLILAIATMAILTLML